MISLHLIFLSPHFDDVALSCGGLVNHLVQLGHTVEVWTIMGGLPTSNDFSAFAQEMHLTWGMTGDEVVRIRRGEDRAACQVMGVQSRHFDWPDAIYRKDPETSHSLVNNDDELFGKQPEAELVGQIKDMVLEEISSGAKLVIPIGLGHHIDHRAVRQAGDLSGRVSLFYADYPYILKDMNNPKNHRYEWSEFSYPLGDGDLDAWQQAVLSYRSQLSMFWRDQEEALLALRNYWAGGGGQFWRKRKAI